MSEEQEGEINYRVLFMLGLVFLIMGIGGIFTIGFFSILLLAVGVVLLVVSLANRDQWTKSSKET